MESKQPGFYIGYATTVSGQPLYLAIERITEKNTPFWRRYLDMTDDTGLKMAIEFVDFHQALSQEVRHVMDYKLIMEQEYKHLFGEDYQEMATYVTSDKFQASWPSLKKGLKDGIIGLHRAIPASYSDSDSKIRYVVYASREPIEAPLHQQTEEENYGFYFRNTNKEKREKDFVNHYDQLVMSMAMITDEASTSTTHMGIFKNVSKCLNPNADKGISTLLHGFAATFAQDVLKKTVQVNQPIGAMKGILKAALGKVEERPSDELEDKQVNHCTVQSDNSIVIPLAKLAGLYKKDEAAVSSNAAPTSRQGIADTPPAATPTHKWRSEATRSNKRKFTDLSP